MKRSLPVLSPVPSARTCVWVDAGVLNYRLCDHGFACEACPLDAAIRSDPRLVLRQNLQEPEPGPTLWSFPNDRLYADEHLWVQVVSAGHVRTGVDAGLARLMPPVREVRPAFHDSVLRRGQPLFSMSFDGGELELPSPVGGSVCCWSERLDATPSLLMTDPYTAGWVAEIVLDDDRQLADLRHAAEACEQARLAMRRFGRQAAFGLLALQNPEDSWIDPALIEATRRAIGTSSYLAMVRGVLLQGGC
ncbi:MAG: hypothetical protein JSR77_06780 [Planctomycetes bacterium]|nr:hypothetical protein [Planctomycetota bacterium]